MIIVKTWKENTKEAEEYLKYNGYEKAKRIGKTNMYICKKEGEKLKDVKRII
jgi:hypothetical protein